MRLKMPARFILRQSWEESMPIRDVYLSLKDVVFIFVLHTPVHCISHSHSRKMKISRWSKLIHQNDGRSCEAIIWPSSQPRKVPRCEWEWYNQTKRDMPLLLVMMSHTGIYIQKPVIELSSTCSQNGVVHKAAVDGIKWRGRRGGCCYCLRY